MNKMLKKARGGFTLIELLIVIGLLGALTALILPSLSANREDALLDVCDYNQAGTLRVLKQYQQFYNQLPSGMHTGLDSVGATMSMPAHTAGQANGNLMDEDGVTPIGPTASTITTLDALQAQSLIAAGLAEVAVDEGYELAEPAAGTSVIEITTDWVDDGTAPYTFRGRTIADYTAQNGDTGAGGSMVIALFIAPTVDWESGHKNTTAWAGNAEVKLSVDLEGKCPIPADEFTYYIAYVQVFNDGTKAKLIGSSCPECGIINK